MSDLISNLALGYRINLSPLPGTDKDEISITTGDNDFLGTPRSARINQVGSPGFFTDTTVPPGGTPVTWANIALIQPYFKASVILGLVAANYGADAIRLRVVAHEVQSL